MIAEKPLTKKQLATAERRESIEKLRGWIKPGDTIHTILRHVSSSGMSRRISLVANVEGEPLDVSYWAARAMGDRMKDGAIVIGGCGMDMGFALVYNLSRTLFPNGFPCCGKHCPSNDHSNGDRNHRKGHKHNGDGGYAIRHRWL